MIEQILVFPFIIFIGLIVSKLFLDIFNIICYFVLDYGIKYGNDWIQKKISNILI